jgi:hypothetical protein
MHVQIFSAAMLFVGTFAALAAAQSDPYTLRLMLGNDAYVWEQMPGYDNAPQPPRDVLNPGARQNAGRNANLSAGVSMPTTQPLNKSAENALNFYGGGQQARNVLNQMPQRPSSMAATNGAPAPRSMGAKPFGNASNGTTISPYLNLFREEQSENIPNYYAFVRPQQQQMEQNRQQQMQTNRLQRQVQQAMYQAPASGGAPGTGHATRFGNTGGYYRR